MLLITAQPIRNLRTPASADMNKRGFLEQASLPPLPNPPPLFPFLPIPYPLSLSTPATQAKILAFLHVIRQRNVSCPLPVRDMKGHKGILGAGHDLRLGDTKTQKLAWDHALSLVSLYVPLCRSREEGMIHFFVGSHVKKPESGLFSDWTGNNTDDLRWSQVTQKLKILTSRSSTKMNKCSKI